MIKRFFSSVFPVKGDRPGEVFRKLAVIILSIVVVVCAVLIAQYYLRSYQNRSRYATIAGAYGSSSPPASQVSSEVSKYPAGMQAGFTALYDRNPDIKGMLTIPGTAVNYPVVEASDNDFYLTHDFDRADSSYGALFLDFRDNINPLLAAKPLSKNLIIYGHNMKDGQMFHDLRRFQEIDTFKTSSLITFNTIYGDAKWKVFAAFMANTEPKLGYVFNYLVTDFATDDQFAAYVKEAKARSFFNVPVDVQPGDTLLTLSTCAYELPDGAERLVVMARRVRDGESTDIGVVTKNKASLDPCEPMR